jgi:uncharacterized protein with HEPN domain
MKNDLIFVGHIFDNINEIEKSFSDINKKVFLKNKLLQDATIRRIEIIGESSKNISINLKNKYDKIPWKIMAGIRDVIVHSYFDVDLDKIWNIVKKEFPKLKKEIEKILKENKI